MLDLGFKKGAPPENLPVTEEIEEKKFPSAPSFFKLAHINKFPPDHFLVTKKPILNRLLVILIMAVLTGIIITFGIYIARRPKEIILKEAQIQAPEITFLEEDKDKDELTVLEEMKAGTDPENQDTDGDGLPDGWEVRYILDPVSAADAMTDIDWDGLTNLEEYNYKGNPNNPDTDGDGYKDGHEVQRGYDPAGPGKLPQEILKKKKEIKPEIQTKNIILIGPFGFSPPFLTVPKDTTVVWVNQDIKPHRVMGGILDSGVLLPGHSWQYTFSEAGIFHYFDAFNINLQGKVVVIE